MLVAVATMVCGVLTIALPVSIVGSNFQMEYEKLEREKKKRQQAAEAVEASHKVELISPLQQELSKLSEQQTHKMAFPNRVRVGLALCLGLLSNTSSLVSDAILRNAVTHLDALV